MKPFALPLLALAISSPAHALTIDLLAHPYGQLEVYNGRDDDATFAPNVGVMLLGPMGFNINDPATWTIPHTVSYTFILGGGAFPLGEMTLCGDVSVIGNHICPQSRNNFILLSPGFTTLTYGTYGSIGAIVPLATLTVDDSWFRSPPYIEEAIATPIPGAALLFATGLSLLLLWRRYANRYA